MSSLVVNRPRPKRIVAAGTGASPNSARRTCDGVADAELHAEPDDTAMSLIPMSSESPSTPSKLTCRLCGSRCSSDPLTTTPSSFDAEAGEQAIAQRREAAAFFGPLRARDRAGAAEPDDARHVERAGSQPALLAAAANRRRELRALPHVERAAALRPVHLVAGDRDADRCRARRRRSRSSPPPAPRRNGRARRARARSRRSPRAAESRRSRCWPPSR